MQRYNILKEIKAGRLTIYLLLRLDLQSVSIYFIICYDLKDYTPLFKASISQYLKMMITDNNSRHNLLFTHIVTTGKDVGKE